MRIATANAYDASLESLMNRQVKLSDTQEQMTTGKRVNHASDDPAAAARAARAVAASARSTANQRAVDASNNAMTLTESALGDANDLLQSARDAIVAAGNASYGDSERKSLAASLSDIRSQLLSIANRTDGAGTYLFGGQSSASAPFVDTSGGVQYAGSAGQTQAASGEQLPLTIDGAAAWMTARTGNGTFTTQATTSTGSAWIDAGHVDNPSLVTGNSYAIKFSVSGGATTYSVYSPANAATPMTGQTNLAFKAPQAIQIDGLSATIAGTPANGDEFQMQPSTPTLSVFDALDQAITNLQTPNKTSTQVTQDNTTSLTSIDSALGQLQSTRSAVGATLTRIDGVTDRLSALKLSSETERSNAEDLDMTQAISDFSNQQTGYDAALKAYSLVQKLSLFNYIGS
jgi:flagellar hook-associated protein 3 FlgL